MKEKMTGEVLLQNDVGINVTSKLKSSVEKEFIPFVLKTTRYIYLRLYNDYFICISRLLHINAIRV